MPALNLRISSREALIEGVRGAAELEHSLCCQYLFAAFSMKGGEADPTSEFGPGAAAPRIFELCREAKRDLLTIARQEMNHLAIWCNLLGSMGVAPHFKRQLFPVDKAFDRLHVRLELLPFTPEVLDKFIWLERPIGYRLNEGEDPDAHSVGELNLALREATIAIEANLAASGDTLFTAPEDNQATNESLFDVDLNYYGIELHPIRDLASALAAFDQISSEGEGAIQEPDVLRRPSHFNRLCRLRDRWLELGSDIPLARDVARNPYVPSPAEKPRKGATAMVAAEALLAVRLFDLAYEAQLMMLCHLFLPWHGSTSERRALIKLAFFPLMTMALRPLGELAVLRPSGVNGLFAGAAFQCDGAALDEGRKDGRVPWDQVRERLEALRKGACELASVDARYGYLAQNFERLLQGMDPMIGTTS